MSDVYEQFANCFKDVQLHVLQNANLSIAGKFAFKWSRSNLRVTCFLHVLGEPMVKGIANGGGYDRCSAALQHAISKLAPSETQAKLAKLAPQMNSREFYSVLRDGEIMSRQLT